MTVMEIRAAGCVPLPRAPQWQPERRLLGDGRQNCSGAAEPQGAPAAVVHNGMSRARSAGGAADGAWPA